MLGHNLAQLLRRRHQATSFIATTTNPLQYPHPQISPIRSKLSKDRTFSMFHRQTEQPHMATRRSNDPVFRAQAMEYENQSCYLEKRQLFLRSYRFSRKQSLSERVRSSLGRVKRVVCRRLRSVRRIRRLVLSRFRYGFWCRRRRIVRFLHTHNRNSSSYCFC